MRQEKRITLHVAPEALFRDSTQCGYALVFVGSDAVEILIRVDTPAAAGLIALLPFELQAETPVGAIHALPLQRWARWASNMVERGRAVYEQLTAQTPRELRQADPDTCRVFGVALEMIGAGQVQKGVNWCNRHLLMSRRPLISIVGTEPLQLKCEAGILTLKDSQMSIEPWH